MTPTVAVPMALAVALLGIPVTKAISPNISPWRMTSTTMSSPRTSFIILIAPERTT